MYFLQLQEHIMDTFAKMHPEAKLRLVVFIVAVKM
jgi:hypothetical protein